MEEGVGIPLLDTGYSGLENNFLVVVDMTLT